MILPFPPLPFLAGCLLVVGPLAGWAWARRRILRRRAFLEVHPGYRAFLRINGLTEVEQFLRLQAELVSGHPDRQVARVPLGKPPEALTAYLKREHHVPWTVRLGNALAGFGFVSRAVREARTLQALQREGIGCPEWLAAGEDGRGRAFLLTRAVGAGVDLRVFLRDEADPAARRRLAGRLGRSLARLHEAGFAHPDLYAKHVLVEPGRDVIHFLDWQRSRRRPTVSWARRVRDLAALHATLAASLASPRERLACLRAYFTGLAQRPERPKIVSSSATGVEKEGGPYPRARVPRVTLRAIEKQARRLLGRRHIREKRQLPLAPGEQGWTCLEGEALCVTPLLQRLEPGGAARWLSLERLPLPPDQSVARRWLLLPGLSRALLVRRQGWRPLDALGTWLLRRPLASPEHRQAALLLRLQRHAVTVPRVLAMGQRLGRLGRVESFLLTEPCADTVRLDTWLKRQAQRAATGAGPARREVLSQAGALLQRLHEATCYLRTADAAGVLAVHVRADGEPVLVLGGVEGVGAHRRARPGLARRDVAVLLRALARAGCRRADLRLFLKAYRPAPPPLPVATAGVRLLSVKEHTVRPRPLLASRGYRTDHGFIHVEREEGTHLMRRGAVTPVPGHKTLWQRLFRGVRRLRQRPDWPDFAGGDWADRIMGLDVTDRFHAKQGRATGRLVLPPPAGGGSGDVPGPLTVYLKRHYELPWWHGYLATLWPGGDWSPALQEWRHLEWARGQGVPVPAVVAAGEFIGPLGKLQSFLAVEELTGMLPLHEAIPLAAARLDPPSFQRWKRSLVEEMARLARLLHDRRCFHKDFYLCHFYVAEEDTRRTPSWRDRVYLIDLHRLGRHPWSWWLWQTKDLAQLLYSSAVAGVRARDRLAFWRAYRGTGPRLRSERWLRWWVLFKWRRYQRHNARHKPENGSG